jgi:hypothetical protein
MIERMSATGDLVVFPLKKSPPRIPLRRAQGLHLLDAARLSREKCSSAFD